MVKNIKLLASVILCTSMIVLGCSSGGGGGGNPPPTPPSTTPPTTTPPATPPTGQISTITGTVSAPSGQLAKLQHKSLFDRFVALLVSESIAQVGGLQPVSNTNILLFRIDDQGNPVGNVLASTTTDTSGNYALNLPSGTNLSSNLILQASSSTTPTGVNDPNLTTLNCPAVNSVLNVDPAAQVATLAIIASGGSLADFTNGELTGFLAQVQIFAQAVTPGLSIQATVTNIQTALQTAIDTAIASISSPGETAPPQNIGGKYNTTKFNAGMDRFGNIIRSLKKGTLTINAENQTWVLNQSNDKLTRSVTCPAGGTNCQRIFTTTTETSNDLSSGTYQLGGHGKIILITITDATSEDPVDLDLGFINQDGTIIVNGESAVEEDAFLFLAVKEGTGLSIGSIDGSTFISKSFEVIVPESGSFASLWNSHTIKLFKSRAVFSGNNINLTGLGTEMSQTVFCTETPGSCETSATLNVGINDEDDFSGTYTVSPVGNVVFTDPITLETKGGRPLSPDANFSMTSFFAAVEEEGKVTIELGLNLSVREGANFNTASLNGTYNFVNFEETFESSSRSEIAMSNGTITFDGAGGVTVFGIFSGVVRNECVGGGTSCPFISLSADPGSGLFNDSGTYTITPSGEVTMTLTSVEESGSFSVVGAVSQNGSVLIISDAADNDPIGESTRSIGIGLKQ